MADATRRSNGDLITITAENSISQGQVIQLKDGRAGFADNSITAGDPGEIRVTGIARLVKTSGIVILDGGEVYWDRSATAAHYKQVLDRDFYVGTAQGDTTSTQTIVDVALNVKPSWTIDVARDAVLTVPVGTQGWNTMGAFRRGGASNIVISATSEAQKLDILSVDGFTPAANAIVEAVFTVPSDGSGTVVDVSIGVANATNATDADSITEHCFLHLDANNTAIRLQSKDGSTTVASTDTTTTYTEGSAVANRVYLWMDMRNVADIQCYVNGSLVLASTVFNLGAAVGPLFLLAHIEKTSSTDTYELCLHSLKARIAEQ